MQVKQEEGLAIIQAFCDKLLVRQKFKKMIKFDKDLIEKQIAVERKFRGLNHSLGAKVTKQAVLKKWIEAFQFNSKS